MRLAGFQTEPDGSPEQDRTRRHSEPRREGLGVRRRRLRPGLHGARRSVMYATSRPPAPGLRANTPDAARPTAERRIRPRAERSPEPGPGTMIGAGAGARDHDLLFRTYPRRRARYHLHLEQVLASIRVADQTRARAHDAILGCGLFLNIDTKRSCRKGS